MRESKLLALLTSLVIATPFASAAPFDSIAKSMGMMWNAMGAIFSFEFVSNSPGIREGILKFLVFILILRVVMYALSGVGRSGQGFFDKKTATIIGFVVATITVMFTPNTGLFASVIALMVPLALIGFMVHYAMMVLDKSWLQHLFGFILLFVTVFVTQFAIDSFSDPNWNGFANQAMNNFILTVLEFTLAVVVILMVIKLISIFGGEKGLFKGGGSGGGKGNNSNNKVDNTAQRVTQPTAADEAAEKQTLERGLDTSKPGKLVVTCYTRDGSPIPGVNIEVYPKGSKLRSRMSSKQNMQFLKGLTDGQGRWPQGGAPADVGSGVITVKAKKQGFFDVSFLRKKQFVQKTDWTIEAGKTHELNLVFDRENEEPHMFGTKILDIKKVESNRVFIGEIVEASRSVQRRIASFVVEQTIAALDTENNVREKKDRVERDPHGDYFYVWWLFDKKGDYTKMASNPHEYPSDRGDFRALYSELPQKDTTMALGGSGRDSKVTGRFLAVGTMPARLPTQELKPRSVKIPLSAFEGLNLSGNEVVGFGAAQKSFLKGVFGNVDPEKLLFRWSDRLLNTHGKGIVRVTVIDYDETQEKFPTILPLLTPENRKKEYAIWMDDSLENSVAANLIANGVHVERAAVRLVSGAGATSRQTDLVPTENGVAEFSMEPNKYSAMANSEGYIIVPEGVPSMLQKWPVTDGRPLFKLEAGQTVDVLVVMLKEPTAPPTPEEEEEDEAEEDIVNDTEEIEDEAEELVEELEEEKINPETVTFWGTPKTMEIINKIVQTLGTLQNDTSKAKIGDWQEKNKIRQEFIKIRNELVAVLKKEDPSTKWHDIVSRLYYCVYWGIKLAEEAHSKQSTSKKTKAKKFNWPARIDHLKKKAQHLAAEESKYGVHVTGEEVSRGP